VLYNVPGVSFDQSLLSHRYETMAEENALKQARVSRIFPAQRRVNSTLRLKDGRTVKPKGLSAWQMMKSQPYMGRTPPAKRPGVSGITDFFGGIKDAITGTVTTASSIAQPIESVLKNNPSLIGLLRSYVPTINNAQPPTSINLTPTPMTSQSTLGVSNKVWIFGGLGLGALTLVKVMGRR